MLWIVAGPLVLNHRGELLAVPRRTTGIHVQHDIPMVGECLQFVIEFVAVGGMWTAVKGFSAAIWFAGLSPLRNLAPDRYYEEKEPLN